MKILAFAYLSLALSGTLIAQRAAPAERPTAPVQNAPLVGVGGVPGNDPFVQPGVGGDTAQDVATEGINLITVVETWSLAPVDFVTLLEESPDNRLSYDRVRELAAAKKAKLENVMAVTSKSGQRSALDSIDEVRYAREYNQPEANDEIAFPRQFETRNAGDMFESEIVLGPDRKTCDVNFVLQDVRLASVREHRLDSAALPVPSIDFDESKLTTSLTASTGEPRFVGTNSRPVHSDSAPQQTTVAFIRVQSEEFPIPANPAPSSASVRLDLLTFSMERSRAQKILLKARNSSEIYAETKAMLAKGEAQMERTGSIMTKSGQRCVFEEVFEVSYPNEQTPPGFQNQNGGEGAPSARRYPASPSSFYQRNVGLTFEVEPVACGSVIDISVVPHLTVDRGTLQMPQAFARYPAQVLFETRKITTSLTVLNGQPGFVGTMNSPREDGVNERKDSGKTIFAFVRAALVKP